MHRSVRRVISIDDLDGISISAGNAIRGSRIDPIRAPKNPRSCVIYTELTVTPGNLLLSKLTFCPVSFVSQKNRGHDGRKKGRRGNRGGEGIFRRTLGEEMKISNGVRETVYSFRLVVENRDEKSRDMAGT